MNLYVWIVFVNIAFAILAAIFGLISSKICDQDDNCIMNMYVIPVALSALALSLYISYVMWQIKGFNIFGKIKAQ